MEFAWGTVLAIVAILLGAATSLIGMTPAHFRAPRTCLVLSAILLGGMAVMWQALTLQPLWIRLLVGISVGGIVGGGLPEGLRWVGAREKQAASLRILDPATSAVMPQVPLLSLACDNIMLPIPYHGEIWFLETIWIKGVWRLSANPLKPEGVWPEDGVSGMGYRCQVTNYSSVALFGVTMSLDVAVRVIVEEKDGSQRPGAITKNVRPVLRIPKPLGSQESFTFYICGSYDPSVFIEVTPPTYATIEGDDNRMKEQQVAVRFSSTTGGSTLEAFPLKRKHI